MKPIFYLVLLACLPITSFCQDISGVWKGTMYNDSTRQTLEYEIVISKEKGKYAAFSQTCLVVDDKKYYGIKKINVRVAKDGKIVMQDADMVDHNYPVAPNKNVIQLNVLDLVNAGDEATLNGLFVTNRTRDFHDHSGRINVKRVGPIVQARVLDNFRKPVTDISLTASK